MQNFSTIRLIVLRASQKNSQGGRIDPPPLPVRGLIASSLVYHVLYFLFKIRFETATIDGHAHYTSTALVSDHTYTIGWKQSTWSFFPGWIHLTILNCRVPTERLILRNTLFYFYPARTVTYRYTTSGPTRAMYHKQTLTIWQIEMYADYTPTAQHLGRPRYTTTPRWPICWPLRWLAQSRHPVI